MLTLQTAERVEFYTAVPLPGCLLPINVTPIPVPDNSPMDQEIQEVVVMEKIMVAKMSCLELHNCLHGGLPSWGTGMVIMEVKLNQQLAWVDQAPLF
jgi:hypothetical protein